MNTQSVIYLVIGVVIVVLVGRLLAMSGRQYLSTSIPGEQAAAGSAAMLVSVLFHLIGLGLVAFISVLNPGDTAGETMMLRIGITLIVIGIIYAVILGLLRSRRQDELVAEAEKIPARPPTASGGPAAGLNTGLSTAESADPRVSPDGGQVPAQQAANQQARAQQFEQLQPPEQRVEEMPMQQAPDRQAQTQSRPVPEQPQQQMQPQQQQMQAQPMQPPQDVPIQPKPAGRRLSWRR